jgi:hypothetical protein
MYPLKKSKKSCMSTPLIHSSTIQQHLNQIVYAAGTITSISPDQEQALLQLPDQGQVSILLLPNSTVTKSGCGALVLGKVMDGQTIQEINVQIMQGSYGIFCLTM